MASQSWDRGFKSSFYLQSSSLVLLGITTDFQVAEAIRLDRREAVDHDVDGVAEKVLAAVLAALGPVVIGTAIPARDPHRPGRAAPVAPRTGPG